MLNQWLMIRPAEKKDIVFIVRLAVESVSQDPISVTISRKKMRYQLQESIEQNAAIVSEINGSIVGAVVWSIHDSFWFTEKQASLLMFYCPNGGEGYKLLRAFAKTVQNDKSIGMAYVSLERNMGEKYIRAFKRLGFTRPNPGLVMENL